MSNSDMMFFILVLYNILHKIYLTLAWLNTFNKNGNYQLSRKSRESQSQLGTYKCVIPIIHYFINLIAEIRFLVQLGIVSEQVHLKERPI